MSALDAANAHPLAAAKLAEWGVEVEEDLISLEPADIGELCSLMPKIPSRKFVVLMEKLKAKKMCHPQGGFFLSFSGLFRGVFFLRVDFLKGEKQL